MPKGFKSPDPKFNIKKIHSTKRPKSVSPKKTSYENLALKSSDKKSKCTFIHSDTGKRCKIYLGAYPEFCHLHTMLVNNLYISKSQITNGGNGLFVGPYGFKKGESLGKYSYPWMEVSEKTLTRRCKDDNCWSYVFCHERKGKDERCWDGLDIRSTLMRNINDAHGSEFKNNCYFDVIKGEVHVISKKSIQPYTECFVDYGKYYWLNKNN